MPTRSSVATVSRRPIENDLKATRMVLPSYLAKRGYPNITRVATGVIDYYGCTGFSKELKISASFTIARIARSE